jgi:hypothetical protein
MDKLTPVEVARHSGIFEPRGLNTSFQKMAGEGDTDLTDVSSIMPDMLLPMSISLIDSTIDYQHNNN